MEADESSEQLQQAHDAAIHIARASGAAMRTYFPHLSACAPTRALEAAVKEDNPADIVTALDRAIERQIQHYLMSRFPHVGFIGEEGGVTLPVEGHGDARAKYYWVVDPIDGTTNFVHRFPQSCVSIALLRDGQPVVGVVYEPMHDQLYTAIRDRGAYLNLQHRLGVSGVAALQDALVCTEFGSYEWRRPEMSAVLAQQREALALVPAQGVRCLGSAALNLCHVASGQLDLYYQYGIHAWDIAAGVLVLQEAGGRAGSLTGRDAAAPFDVAGRSILAVCTLALERDFLCRVVHTAGAGITEDAFERDALGCEHAGQLSL